MEEKLRLKDWLFVTVTVCDALSEPTATLPKFRLVGETVTGAMPVPESVTTCGVVGALSLIAICAPLVAPRAVGWKKTTKVQLAPGATGTPPVQGETTPGEVVKGPVGMMEENVRSTDILFVTVTVCDVLVAPTATLPKFKFVVESVTGEAEFTVKVTGSLVVDSPFPSVTTTLSWRPLYAAVVAKVVRLGVL